MTRNWEEVKVNVRQICTEAEQDRNAHEGRVSILGVDLGVTITKFVLRALQTLKLYPRA